MLDQIRVASIRTTPPPEDAARKMEVHLNIEVANPSRLDEQMRSEFGAQCDGVALTGGGWVVRLFEPVTNEQKSRAVSLALAHDPEELSTRQLELKAADDAYHSALEAARSVEIAALYAKLDPDLALLLDYIMIELERLRGIVDRSPRLPE